MTDAELRALVREAVARHLGHQPAMALPPVHDVVASPPARSLASTWAAHPSHHQYLALVSTSTACVIEPSVSCDHCGYCKSHGH